MAPKSLPFKFLKDEGFEGEEVDDDDDDDDDTDLNDAADEAIDEDVLRRDDVCGTSIGAVRDSEAVRLLIGADRSCRGLKVKYVAALSTRWL